MRKVWTGALLGAAMSLCAAPHQGCGGADFQDDPPPMMDGATAD